MGHVLAALLIAGGMGLLSASIASAAPLRGSGAREAVPNIVEPIRRRRSVCRSDVRRGWCCYRPTGRRFRCGHD